MARLRKRLASLGGIGSGLTDGVVEKVLDAIVGDEGILDGVVDKIIDQVIDAIKQSSLVDDIIEEVTEAVTKTIEGTKQLASDIMADPAGMAKKGWSSIVNAVTGGDEEEEGGITGLARGGIVTKPAYLPASGTVVGEHSSWSGGKGAAEGGIPDGPGGEAIIPLTGQAGGQILAAALAPAIAGAILNELMMARAGGAGAEGGGGQTVIQDNSTNQNVTNNTVVRSPSPRGREMHFERGDFVHKIA